MQDIHRGFALRKPKVPAKTGMGRDFVAGYQSPYYPRVSVTMVFWVYPQ